MTTVPLKTLVLSPNLQVENMFPLSVINASGSDGAVVKVLTEKFTVIKNYDRPVLTPSREDIYWPSIVMSPHMPNYKKRMQMKKYSLWLREGGKCFFCDKVLKESECTIDHLIPTSKGGKNNWENVACACISCNAEKGNTLPTGRWAPKYKPYEPSYFKLIEMRRKIPIIIHDPAWKDFLPHWQNKIIFKDLETGTSQILDDYVLEAAE